MVKESNRIANVLTRRMRFLEFGTDVYVCNVCYSQLVTVIKKHYANSLEMRYASKPVLHDEHKIDEMLFFKNKTNLNPKVYNVV